MLMIEGQRLDALAPSLPLRQKLSAISVVLQKVGKIIFALLTHRPGDVLVFTAA